LLFLSVLHADLDVSDIENLQLQKEQHKKNIEGMNEAITKFRKKQRHLEDEEANILKQKEEIINMMRFQKKTREERQSRVDMRRRLLEDLFQEDDVESSTRKAGWSGG